MMKNGELPSVALKAVLTSQNCFWTFAHLVKELEEEHRDFMEREEENKAEGTQVMRSLSLVSLLFISFSVWAG